MYKIVRGCGIVEKGTPYLIVVVTAWQDKNIGLERFILIVEGNGEPTLLPLRTAIDSLLGNLPKDQIDLVKLLDNEVVLAKEHYASWLNQQIGEKALTQLKNLEWHEMKDTGTFAVTYYRFNEKARKIVTDIADNSYCEDLRKFMWTVQNLRLKVQENP